MALTAGSIVVRAARTLNDTAHATWSEDELREYVSEAMKAAVLVRPEVNPVTTTVQLVPGVKQTIPDDGFVLIEVLRNMGLEEGSDPPAPGEPGRVITPTSLAALDQGGSDWPTETPEDVVQSSVYDVRNRKTYYVYPPQDDPAHFIEIVYARIPPEVLDAAAAAEDDADDTLPIDDIYAPALIDYVLHRARIRDISVEGQGMAASSQYFNWFMGLLLGEAEKQDASITIRHESIEGDGG